MPNVKGSARIGGYKDRRYRSPVAMDNGDRDIVKFSSRPELHKTYHFASNDNQAFQGLEWMGQDTIFKKQITIRWW